MKICQNDLVTYKFTGTLHYGIQYSTQCALDIMCIAVDVKHHSGIVCVCVCVYAGIVHVIMDAA